MTEFEESRGGDMIVLHDCEITPAQRQVLRSFDYFSVRPTLVSRDIVATVEIGLHAQKLKLTVEGSGFISKAEIE